MSFNNANQIYSYVRVSSTGSANSIIGKITISTSENHSVRFHSLFMLTLIWCSTPFTAIVVLWKTLFELVHALARWWSWEGLKSVCGLWSGDKIFFSEAYLSLTWCSNEKEGSWLQLHFDFYVLMNIVAFFIGMSSFPVIFRFLLEVFS